MHFRQNIYLTVDVVVFARQSGKYHILLIQRKNEPFKGYWALPGGFVDEDEDLEDAALRELEEETGLRLPAVKQFRTFGKPGRDPRGRTVSVVFIGETDMNQPLKADTDAAKVQWFPVDNLPPLAFDHREIIDQAWIYFQSQHPDIAK